MKLTEELKTHIIGILLTIVLVCQCVASYAGAKQQDSYNRMMPALGHSNKSLTLLNNVLSLAILDEANRSKHIEYYRKTLNEEHEQHRRIGAEEGQLLKQINSWGKIERRANLFGSIVMAVVMWLYLNLISRVSKRIKKT